MIQIQVDDWNMNGNHDYIGALQTSVKDLLEHGRGAKIPFVNEKQKKKSDYKNSGHLLRWDGFVVSTTVAFKELRGTEE